MAAQSRSHGRSRIFGEPRGTDLGIPHVVDVVLLADVSQDTGASVQGWLI